MKQLIKDRYGDNTYNFIQFTIGEDGWGRGGDDWLTDRRDPGSQAPYSFGLSNDMHGGKGNDKLESYLGDDNLFGGVGDDFFFVHDAATLWKVDVLGGDGIDTLVLGGGEITDDMVMVELDPRRWQHLDLAGTFVNVKDVEFLYYAE